MLSNFNRSVDLLPNLRLLILSYNLIGDDSMGTIARWLHQPSAPVIYFHMSGVLTGLLFAFLRASSFRSDFSQQLIWQSNDRLRADTVTKYDPSWQNHRRFYTTSWAQYLLKTVHVCQRLSNQPLVVTDLLIEFEQNNCRFYRPS